MISVKVRLEKWRKKVRESNRNFVLKNPLIKQIKKLSWKIEFNLNCWLIETKLDIAPGMLPTNLTYLISNSLI